MTKFEFQKTSIVLVSACLIAVFIFDINCYGMLFLISAALESRNTSKQTAGSTVLMT
jgi:hypothetical protein